MCADHLDGGTANAPEARLQLALDVPSLAASLGTVCALRPRLGRVEVGTPLMLHAGVAAIELVRSVLPPGVRVVADTKICDGGNRIAAESGLQFRTSESKHRPAPGFLLGGLTSLEQGHRCR